MEAKRDVVAASSPEALGINPWGFFLNTFAMGLLGTSRRWYGVSLEGNKRRTARNYASQRRGDVVAHDSLTVLEGHELYTVPHGVAKPPLKNKTP